jgi:molybdate transport system regulatory protein
MSKTGGNELKLVLRVDFPGSVRLGRGKVQLMGHIRDTGSISAAGRAMDMSYRRAWLLVDEMNHMFDEPVVESQRGGKQGGGAALTPFGEELLARMKALQEKAEKAIDADLAWLAKHRAPATDKSET